MVASYALIRTSRYRNQDNQASRNSNKSFLHVTEIPEPPEDLTEEAVLWWNYYCTVMIEGNCLRRHYLTCLHNLCIAHMLRTQYMEAIKEEGVILQKTKTHKDGSFETQSVSNPLVEDLQRILINMDKFLSSLGLTAYTDHVLNFDSTPSGIEQASGPPPVNFEPPIPQKITEIDISTELA